MNCKQCGGKTKVVDSQEAHGKVARKRRCEMCGSVIYTEEHETGRKAAREIQEIRNRKQAERKTKMIRLMLDVETDEPDIQGLKEAIAMAMEQIGAVKVMDISVSPYWGRLPDTVGDRIRKARTEALMTQKELGEAIYVSESMVCYLETNRRNPSKETLAQIAEVLGVNQAWLACKSDKKE